MPNIHRGETAEFVVNNKTYALRFSMNALCELENAFGRGIIDIIEEMRVWSPADGPDGQPIEETEEQRTARVNRIRLSFVRTLFWAGLRERHPQVTLADAGELISDMGGLLVAMERIAAAFAAALPEARSDDDARPTAPAPAGQVNGNSGTGLHS